MPISLTDLYAAQIESHFFFYLMAGACTTCLCLTRYICTKMTVEALFKQKVVNEASESPQSNAAILWLIKVDESVTKLS